MRFAFVLVLLLPPLASAQPTAEQKQETVKWVKKLEAPGGGFYIFAPNPDDEKKPSPSLRATSAAVRVLKYLGAEIPNKGKHAEFVLKCFDPKTGGFAEPGLQPDVPLTSVGVMAAMELGIPKEKFAKAMDYLKENAKTFEEVRIGAAAVEAWGVKDCPFKLDSWQEVVEKGLSTKNPPVASGGARALGSVVAFTCRLGLQKENDSKPAEIARVLDFGQLPDGGWCRENEKASDIETTYRVMRAYMLLKQKPKDVKKLRAFLDSHRNKDGGYAVKPGDKSSASGTYYCVIISKWLDEMEK